MDDKTKRSSTQITLTRDEVTWLGNHLLFWRETIQDDISEAPEENSDEVENLDSIESKLARAAKELGIARRRG